MLLSLLGSTEAPQLARVESLIAFDPRLGGEEDAERKVLFCHPPELPLSEQLRTVGLCEALVAFSRRFGDAPCEAVRTTNRRYSLLEVEPNIWFCLVTLCPAAPAADAADSASEEEDGGGADELLRERLRWLHGALRMFVGGLARFGPARADELRAALRASAGPLVSLCAERGLLSLERAPLASALSAARLLLLPRGLHLSAHSALHELREALNASRDARGGSGNGAAGSRGEAALGGGAGGGSGATALGGADGGPGCAGATGAGAPADAAPRDPAGAPLPALALALVLHSGQLVWSDLARADTTTLATLLDLLLAARPQRAAERAGAGGGESPERGGWAGNAGSLFFQRLSVRSPRAASGLRSPRVVRSPGGAMAGAAMECAARCSDDGRSHCSEGCGGGSVLEGSAEVGEEAHPPTTPPSARAAGSQVCAGSEGAPADSAEGRAGGDSECGAGLGELCSGRVRAMLSQPCVGGSLVVGVAGAAHGGGSVTEGPGAKPRGLAGLLRQGGRGQARGAGADGGSVREGTQERSAAEEEGAGVAAPLVWVEELPPSLLAATQPQPTQPPQTQTQTQTQTQQQPARLLVFRMRELTAAFLVADVAPAQAEGTAQDGADEAAEDAARRAQWAARVRGVCAAVLGPLEAALSEQAARVRAAAGAEAAAGSPQWALLDGDRGGASLRGSAAALGGSEGRGGQQESHTNAMLLRAHALLASAQAEAAREQRAAALAGAAARGGGEGTAGLPSPAAYAEVSVRGRRPADGWVVGRRVGTRESLLLLDAKALPGLGDAQAAEARAWRLELAEAAGRPLGQLLHLGRGVPPVIAQPPPGARWAELGAVPSKGGSPLAFAFGQQRSP